MKTEIKAIETRYCGCLFRSRLEARWAVFYDSLGIEWRYEPEGFDLGEAGLYLPDFWLPKLEKVIEIKPHGQFPSAFLEKVELATEALKAKKGYIFWGDIPRGDPIDDCCGSALAVRAVGGWDTSHWWCECPNCQLLGVEFQGRADRIGCGCCPGNDRILNSGSPRILHAYEQARSARF